MQFQSNDVISSCAIWLRRSDCLEHSPLTTGGNLRSDNITLTQRSFYICRHKRVGNHTIYVRYTRELKDEKALTCCFASRGSTTTVAVGPWFLFAHLRSRVYVQTASLGLCRVPLLGLSQSAVAGILS